MNGEIVAALLGLSSPETLVLKAGATLVAELLRHPESDSAQPVAIVSNTPGRLRLRVPAIKRDSSVLNRVETRLTTLTGVRDVKASPVTGTVLVTYAEGTQMPEAIRRAAEMAIAALRLIPSDGDYTLTAQGVADDGAISSLAEENYSLVTVAQETVESLA